MSDATALREAVDKLKTEFILRTTIMPNMLLIPKRKDHVKLFSECLHADSPEAGSAPYIFDQLWRLDRQCFFLGLEVYIANDVDDLTVDFDMNKEMDAEAPSIQ